MSYPAISIIIPVYNVETYLRPCRDSIINQTFHDIEIICVNDGSTDNSLSILKDYAAKDDRFVIIDIENGGQGLARNIAIELAKGEYIGFIDSDDWIDLNMYQELYSSAKKHSSDIVLCEFGIFEASNNLITYPEHTKIPIHSKYDEHSFSWKEISEQLFKINSSPWNKLFKRSLLINHNIRYASGVYYQDILLVYKSLYTAKKISLVRKPLYTYRYLRDGSTTADKGRKQFDIFVVLNLLQKSIEENSSINRLKHSFLKYKFDQYLFHLNQIKKEFKTEFWKQLISEFENIDSNVQEELLASNIHLKLGVKFGLHIYNASMLPIKCLNQLHSYQLLISRSFKKHIKTTSTI